MQQMPGEGTEPVASNGVNAAARRRRRGLYGPPPRLTATSPLTGRLLWYVGDWGRASEHIGLRWEELAVELLAAKVAADEYLLVLGSTRELMSAVLGTGLAHADAALLSVEDDALVLEPLDFKWSLETASIKQVSAETAGRLLATSLPLLEDALRQAREALSAPPDLELQPTDGRFVAPIHPANAAAIEDDPHLPVLLLPISAQTFFRPLPAWSTALAVARLDRHDLEREARLDVAERYYRVGAGVLGALVRLETGLFEEQAKQVDAGAMVDLLPRHTSVNRMLMDLERRLTARRALEDRLHELPRSAYPFGRLRTDLQRSGVPTAVLENRGPMGRLHGTILREITRAVLAAGREQVAAGATTEAALDALYLQSPDWARLGTRHARARAAQLLARGTAPSEPTSEDHG